MFYYGIIIKKNYSVYYYNFDKFRIILKINIKILLKSIKISKFSNSHDFLSMSFYIKIFMLQL